MIWGLKRLETADDEAADTAKPRANKRATPARTSAAPDRDSRSLEVRIVFEFGHTAIVARAGVGDGAGVARRLHLRFGLTVVALDEPAIAGGDASGGLIEHYRKRVGLINGRFEQLEDDPCNATRSMRRRSAADSARTVALHGTRDRRLCVTAAQVPANVMSGRPRVRPSSLSTSGGLTSSAFHSSRGLAPIQGIRPGHFRCAGH